MSEDDYSVATFARPVGPGDEAQATPVDRSISLTFMGIDDGFFSSRMPLVKGL